VTSPLAALGFRAKGLAPSLPVPCRYGCTLPLTPVTISPICCSHLLSACVLAASPAVLAALGGHDPAHTRTNSTESIITPVLQVLCFSV
jgi:hypothetical protein